MTFLLHLLNEFAGFYWHDFGVSLLLMAVLFALTLIRESYLRDSAAMGWVLAAAIVGVVVTIGTIVVRRAIRASKPPLI
jgi:uncharacterized membrane protein YhaH (DUF805 family)